MDILLFIYSSVDRHWGCFHPLTLLNTAAVNICVELFVRMGQICLHSAPLSLTCYGTLGKLLLFQSFHFLRVSGNWDTIIYLSIVDNSGYNLLSAFIVMIVTVHLLCH